MSDSANKFKWLGDGSEGGEFDVADDAIAFASASQGTPFNMRVDAEDATAPYYEVKITGMSKRGSLGAGLVTADGFQPGWKTKGYFYNGNVTNGSAGLIVGFGSRIEEGDVVGVYQRRSIDGEGDAGRRCDIVFYHNGRCLGAGFSLDCGDEKLYPCLHVSGSASVTFSTPPSPTILEREQKGRIQGDPYSGDWAIDQAFIGPELGELSISKDSISKITLEKADTPRSAENEAQYHLYIEIDNSFRTSFEITGKTEAFDEIKFTSGCMSTRMMPRPAFRKMEHFVESALGSDGGFKKMIASERGELIMSGPTAEIICSRFIERFDPVRSA